MAPTLGLFYIFKTPSMKKMSLIYSVFAILLENTIYVGQIRLINKENMTILTISDIFHEN